MAKAMVYSSRDGLKEVTYDDKMSYEFMSGAVDGYIERIPIMSFDKRHIDIWCNEEGKLRSDLVPSAVLTYQGKIYDRIMGNLVFTKSNDEGETISLTDDDIKYIKKFFDDATYLIDFGSGELLVTLSY